MQLSAGLPRKNQIAVLMRVASGYVNNDPVKAKQMFEDAETQMETAADGMDVLNLLSIRAVAALGLDGNSVAKDAVAKAYDLGEELIDEQLMLHPGIAVHEIHCLQDLETASNIGIRVAPVESLRRIQQIQTPVLEALLLTDAAAILSKPGQQALSQKQDRSSSKNNR
jgi:hypothetical protein